MLPPNIPQCRYIKPDGSRCGSPALRGQRHCYFHYQVSRPRAGCHLPPFEDANSVQFGLIEVARALLDDQLDQKKAALLAYILQTASYNLKQVNFSPWWETMVRELPRQPRPRKEETESTLTPLAEETNLEEVTEAAPAGSELGETDDVPAASDDQAPAVAAPLDPSAAVANAVAMVRARAPQIAAAHGWPLPDDLSRDTG